MSNPPRLTSLAIACLVLILAMVVVKAKLAKATEVPLIACLELAQREGIPIATEAQVLRARWKLRFMSPSDPLVRRCKEEVKQYGARK